MSDQGISRHPSLLLSEYLRSLIPLSVSGLPPFLQGADGSFRYTLNGRSAIYQLLLALGIGRGATVLVPAFVCNSVTDAIEAAGAIPVFYDVRSDCAIDLDDVIFRLDRRTRMVLVIHYFGFPQDLAELSKVCRSRGVVLLEDCAHAWLTEVEGRVIGCVGEAAIYSMRKFLPMIDGGGLRVNPSLADRVAFKPLRPQSLMRSIKVHKDVLDHLALFQAGNRLADVKRLLEKINRLFKRSLGDQLTSGSLGVASRGGDGFQFNWADWELSAILRRIIRLTNLDMVKRARRENYSRLHSAISRMSHVRPLFPTLKEGVCAWAYPFIPERREKFDYRLRERGVPAFTFGDPVKGVEAGKFKNADFSRENILLLPCHQKITVKEIEKTLDAIEQLKD